jgi:hypothetical protein
MGFHGRAAAHKPKITMRNAKRRMECCKVEVERWKRVLWSEESGGPSDYSGLGDSRRMLSAPMHSANCKVWCTRNNGLGLFSWFGPLSSCEDTF